MNWTRVRFEFNRYITPTKEDFPLNSEREEEESSSDNITSKWMLNEKKRTHLIASFRQYTRLFTSNIYNIKCLNTFHFSFFYTFSPHQQMCYITVDWLHVCMMEKKYPNCFIWGRTFQWSAKAKRTRNQRMILLIFNARTIQVCQMLYIDAMFRKTGYASASTLPSESHQMLLLLRFQETNSPVVFRGICYFWCITYSYSIDSCFVCVHSEKHICGMASVLVLVLLLLLLFCCWCCDVA